MDWMTNDAELAARLRTVDEHHARMRADAADFPLADKVRAYRRALMIRATAYAAIRAELGAR
jgi:hypothetical protein